MRDERGRAGRPARADEAIWLKRRVPVYETTQERRYRRSWEADAAKWYVGRRALQGGVSLEVGRGVHQQTRGGLQELEETQYWLELLIESGFCPRTDAEAIYAESEELIRIFVTIVKGRKDN